MQFARHSLTSALERRTQGLLLAGSCPWQKIADLADSGHTPAWRGYGDWLLTGPISDSHKRPGIVTFDKTEFLTVGPQAFAARSAHSATIPAPD